jgi:hypothetical protein
LKPKRLKDHVWIYLDPLPVQLCVVFTEKAYNEQIRKNNINTDLPFLSPSNPAATCWFERGGADPFVFIKIDRARFCRGTLLVEAIVHECTHAIQVIERHMGVSAERRPCEYQAYATGHLSAAVLHQMVIRGWVTCRLPGEKRGNS